MFVSNLPKLFDVSLPEHVTYCDTNQVTNFNTKHDIPVPFVRLESENALNPLQLLGYAEPVVIISAI